MVKALWTVANKGKTVNSKLELNDTKKTDVQTEGTQLCKFPRLGVFHSLPLLKQAQR